jgi:hypothetical protein
MGDRYDIDHPSIVYGWFQCIYKGDNAVTRSAGPLQRHNAPKESNHQWSRDCSTRVWKQRNVQNNGIPVWRQLYQQAGSLMMGGNIQRRAGERC